MLSKKTIDIQKKVAKTATSRFIMIIALGKAENPPPHHFKKKCKSFS